MAESPVWAATWISPKATDSAPRHEAQVAAQGQRWVQRFSKMVVLRGGAMEPTRYRRVGDCLWLPILIHIVNIQSETVRQALGIVAFASFDVASSAMCFDVRKQEVAQIRRLTLFARALVQRNGTL